MTHPVITALGLVITTSAFWLAVVSNFIMPLSEAIKWALKQETIEEKVQLLRGGDEIRRNSEAQVQSLLAQQSVNAKQLLLTQAELKESKSRLSALNQENQLLRQQGYLKAPRSKLDRDISMNVDLKMKTIFDTQKPICPFDEQMLCLYLHMNADKTFEVLTFSYSIDEGITTSRFAAQNGVATVIENGLFRYYIKVVDIGAFWTWESERKIKLQLRRVAN